MDLLHQQKVVNIGIGKLRSKLMKFWKREDTRPEWEKMSDDGMNKFLKFCLAVVLFYFGVVTIEALWDRFV